MNDANQSPEDAKPSDFIAQARQKRPSLAADILLLLKHNHKWWLAPIIVVVLFLGLLVVLGGSAAAPFIYTLF